MVLIALQVVLVSIVVFGRYVLNRTPSWGEESALLCMVWFCLLSSAIAYRDDKHLKLNLAEFLVSKKMLKVFDYLIDAGIFVFIFFIITSGIEVTKLTSLNQMTGIRIASSWLYASLPVTGFIMLLFFIEKTLLRFTGGKT